MQKMIFLSLLFTLVFPLSVLAATDIHFSGALVAEPCVIEAGDEAKDVDLGNIVDKELYFNQRTLTKPLTLTLAHCALDMAKSVTITFSGNESSELPGFLAMNPASNAKGIAIGIETLSGQAVLLNKASPPVSLENGKTVILLRAFLQGEPSAITQRSITPGPYSATATFSLSYQ
ncbi:fimbrial protein [Pantoea sp.]|uniref:fimbrial protein n=1 Tax=Pantoea sp. TaxID=69393 RepID=UPI0031D5C09B